MTMDEKVLQEFDGIVLPDSPILEKRKNFFALVGVDGEHCEIVAAGGGLRRGL
jgi:hypothetical protein